MVNRTIISGGPGHGKTTLAEQLRAEQGLSHFLCTDTRLQAKKARGIHPGALYAPSSFDGDWSGLSQWVADTWLNNPGPWVIEGVAAVRAMLKWHDDNPSRQPPCDLFIRLQSQKMELNPRQLAMAEADDRRFEELLAEWPQLRAVVELRP